MKKVQVDSNRATKTMIRLIFVFITIGIWFRWMFWFGFGLLSLQFLMDCVEDYMNNKFGEGKWGVKNKYIEGNLK